MQNRPKEHLILTSCYVCGRQQDTEHEVKSEVTEIVRGHLPETKSPQQLRHTC